MLSTSTLDSRKKEFSDHLEKLAELINEYHRVRFLTKDQRDQFIKSIERIKVASLEASDIGGEEKLKISELVAALEENQKSWTEELKALAKEPEIQRPTTWKVEDGVEDDSQEAYELFQEAMALYFPKLENELNILRGESSLRESWQNPINVQELDQLSYAISDDCRLRWLETYIGKNDPLVKHLRIMHDAQGSTAEDRRLVWCCANAAKEAAIATAAKKTLMASAAHMDVELVAEVRRRANFNAAWKGVDKKLKKFNPTQKPGFFRRNIGKMLGMLAAVPFFLGAGMVIGTVAASFFGIIALPIALPVLAVVAVVSAGIGFLSIAAGFVGDFKKNRRARKAREAMVPISIPESTALSQQPILDTKDSLPFLGAENPAAIAAVEPSAAVLPTTTSVTDEVAVSQGAQAGSGLSQTELGLGSPASSIPPRVVLIPPVPSPIIQDAPIGGGSGQTESDSLLSKSPVGLASQIGQGITPVLIPNRESEAGGGLPAEPLVSPAPSTPLDRVGSPGFSEATSESLTKQRSDASGFLPPTVPPSPTAASPSRRDSLPGSNDGSSAEMAAALRAVVDEGIISESSVLPGVNPAKPVVLSLLFKKPPDEAASPTPSQQSSPRGPAAAPAPVLVV